MSILYVCANGQTYDINLNTTMVKSNGAFKKGENVKLTRCIHRFIKTDNDENHEEFLVEDDNQNRIEINSKLGNCLSFEYTNIQDLWDSKIITNVLHNITKKGSQYEMRKDMEDEALEYIQQVKKYGGELDDPYLESYIYSLVGKIAPQKLIDGRPCSINLLIQKSPNINSGTYPNGTIVISTGLLASLHSEDELVAILAHEISHFVLDHSVLNVNKAISRKKRAEFWATLATGLTAVAETYAATKNKNYAPGLATAAVATLATQIGSSVIDHLGMKYNHEQEEEADKVAIQALKILGYDANALATALSRIEKYYESERLNVAYFDSYTHPALVERIKNCGTANSEVNRDFEKMVSFAVTNVAEMKYADKRFHQCIPYVAQNIDNNVATAADYILMANCLLNTQNSYESNSKAICYIQKAKEISDNDLSIYKSEIIAKLRLGDNAQAVSLINNYISSLNNYSYGINNILNDDIWAYTSEFVERESSWAKKMLIKLNNMN